MAKIVAKTISERVWSIRVCMFLYLLLRSFHNFQTWLIDADSVSTQESMCPRSQIACCSRFAAQLREEAGHVWIPLVTLAHLDEQLMPLRFFSPNKKEKLLNMFSFCIQKLHFLEKNI